MLDRQLYPETAAYFDLLPEGLQSYPHCCARTDLFADTAHYFPALLQLPGIPHEIKQLWHGQLTTTWMPEVYATVSDHLVRETQFNDEQGYEKWLIEINKSIFKRPFYRAIIFLFSTNLLIMGAAERWQKFHQGIPLRIQESTIIADRLSAKGILEYPPHLFNKRMVRSYTIGFRVAMEITKAKQPTININDVSPTRAHFTLSWG